MRSLAQQETIRPAHTQFLWNQREHRVVRVPTRAAAEKSSYRAGGTNSLGKIEAGTGYSFLFRRVTARPASARVTRLNVIGSGTESIRAK
jgi:hypothetical protein